MAVLSTGRGVAGSGFIRPWSARLSAFLVFVHRLFSQRRFCRANHTARSAPRCIQWEHRGCQCEQWVGHPTAHSQPEPRPGKQRHVPDTPRPCGARDGDPDSACQGGSDPGGLLPPSRDPSRPRSRPLRPVTPPGPQGSRPAPRPRYPARPGPHLRLGPGTRPGC